MPFHVLAASGSVVTARYCSPGRFRFRFGGSGSVAWVSARLRRRRATGATGLPRGAATITFLRMEQANQRTLVSSRDSTSASDALWVTYRWMTLGLATTGVVALAVAHSPGALRLLLANRMAFLVLLFGQLGLVMALSAVATRVSTAVAAFMFFAYAALTGVTFSVLFLVYTASSIAATFFVTAGAFAGLSFFGFVTKRDLSAIGRFGIFALFGVIIASVVNMFLRSSGLDWLITLVGVVLFAGLTAYDTQRLKDLFQRGETHANLPLVGALRLYLDFINMFLFLLRILGGRRRS
jgi:FtsH-binding integral membrane protein